jgi:hypothetical protein
MSRWIEDAPITSHGDRDVDHRSVLREPLRLIAPDIIAPHQAIEDRVLLARPVGRHQHANRLPDDLARGIPVKALRPAVPARDPAVAVLGQDRVRRGIDHGSQSSKLDLLSRDPRRKDGVCASGRSVRGRSTLRPWSDGQTIIASPRRAPSGPSNRIATPGRSQPRRWSLPAHAGLPPTENCSPHPSRHRSTSLSSRSSPPSCAVSDPRHPPCIRRPARS